MTTPPRRNGDPGDADYGHARANGIDVGYRGVRAVVHGPLAILAAVFLIIGGSAVYVNYRGFEDVKELLMRSSSDHDLLSCVVSLSPEERTILRRVESRRAFQELCPWLRLP